MASIEPASTRVILPLPDREQRLPSCERHGRFGRVLRAVAAVAAAAVPVVGPIIGAVASARGPRDVRLGGALGGESETLQYLELQRAVERETRMYEAASNVMKARHDATMSSIRNIKS